MGLRRRSAQRELVLQTPQSPPMVLGQHRLSSHSSSEPENSKLSFGKMPPGRAAVPDGEARDPVFQLQSIHLPSLGRTAPQISRLWPLEDHSPPKQTSRAIG